MALPWSMLIAFTGVATTFSVTDDVTAPAMFVTVTDTTAAPICMIAPRFSVDVVELLIVVPLIYVV